MKENYLGEHNNPLSRCIYKYNNLNNINISAINLAYLINWYTRRPVNYVLIYTSTKSIGNRSGGMNRPYPKILDEYDYDEIPNSMLGSKEFRIFTVYNDCISDEYLINLLGIRGFPIVGLPIRLKELYTNTINLNESAEDYLQP